MPDFSVYSGVTALNIADYHCLLSNSENFYPVLTKLVMSIIFHPSSVSIQLNVLSGTGL
jgi:hypothetical protein